MVRGITAVVLSLFCCPTTYAQVAPGAPSFVPQDCHETDCVDLLNNNVTLRIPIMSKRGLIPFNYRLVGNYFVGNGNGTWYTASTNQYTQLQGAVDNVLMNAG